MRGPSLRQEHDAGWPRLRRTAGLRYRPGMSRLERITSDLEVCHGQPAIRGLRYPVEMLLELLSAG
jgi:hypothetical protein